MKPSERIASFVAEFSNQAVPQEAVERAKAAIMDYTGVTLYGVDEESSQIVRRIIDTFGGNPEATIWGTGFKTSVILAALANGTAAHALDYDDSDSVMRAHPSIQLLPALFALGENEHRSGVEIIMAYIIGFEVGAKLGRALNPNHIIQGWLPIGTLGTLMQTMACARLLGLKSDRVQMALGIATNLASGLRCNNGTMAKHLLSGHQSSNAILAALLAREGMNANPEALEDRSGFFENFSRRGISILEQTVDSLGKPLEILQSGIDYKIYPSCRGTHCSIDCSLEIVHRHTLNPNDIEAIEASVISDMEIVLMHHRPQTVSQARFSLEYCISRAILDGKMGPEQFTPKKVQDPAVRALIEKVKPIYRDDFIEKRGSKETTLYAELHVYMKGGGMYSYRVDHARGTLMNPLSLADLEQKFQQCCKGKLSEVQIIQAKQQLRHFEQLQDVADFVSIFYKNQN